MSLEQEFFFPVGNIVLPEFGIGKLIDASARNLSAPLFRIGA